MLASRPPLGWNSWNTFGEHISDQLIRESADAFVAAKRNPTDTELVMFGQVNSAVTGTPAMNTWLSTTAGPSVTGTNPAVLFQTRKNSRTE